ncbi:D-aspartate oxidase [Neocloeon triangulifer]|uniref:D-aspartate oxidase n=1 Tax=Neocloeon triangulifer TaxID=2078957 RepID=UPI00286EF153|nr:D-aspartate oxidase [Neocloeon triangulifer]
MGVKRVGILGAGVVGLNTALQLQSEFPTLDVTIIAEKFNQETTSDGAAGLFRPSSSFSGPNIEITKKWILDSYRFYDALRITGQGEDSGIFQIPAYNFSNYNEGMVKNHLLETVVPVYRAMSEDELEEYPGWKWGSFYKTLIIECREYQPWAIEKITQSGGKFRQRKVNTFSDVEDFDAVINCTGLGAKYLCNDSKLTPIRGQVIKVRAPWVKASYMSDFDTYIIPNRNTITLGGCRNYGSYDLNVCPFTKADIMQRCSAVLPSLAKAEFVRDWVGLRPHRDPVRVEAEMIALPSGKNLPVVHNYGHGGYGVTSSPGTSMHAVQLFKEQHAASISSIASKL